MVVASASGAHIRDASGNEYIDYLMGSGPLLLGHAHPAVVEAVRHQAEKGSSFLIANEKTIELAEAIAECVPCAEKICFNNSGSESTFFALRIARAFTGREKFMKFEGGFHGMHDYALMSNQWTSEPADFPAPTANSAGIPRAIEDQVLIGPWNDLETSARLIEEHAGELAAVIVEPMQRSFPPEPGFLEGLRELTQRHGIALIFDEVVTGFRLALGGAQEYYGVVPDLAAVCKGIASGYPISVLCGRGDIMDHAITHPRFQTTRLAMRASIIGSVSEEVVGLTCIWVKSSTKDGASSSRRWSPSRLHSAIRTTSPLAAGPRKKSARLRSL